MTTEEKITDQCETIKKLLIQKNKKYGNSALSQGTIFGLSPILSIKSRIEDKLARLKNDNKDEDEDIILDLLGYFILLRIALYNEKEEVK